MSGDDPDFREPHLRRDDFLGAFAVLQRDGCVLMVQNERHFGGRTVLCWDLPGGQVERGELVADALVRELREETGLEIVPGEFLFVQEGVRERGGRRLYAWRSFFFAVQQWRGEARPGGEVRDVRWWPLAELEPVLIAPYHDSFRAWLRERGWWFGSRWQD